MRRARGAHDVVDARRVEAALGEHAHARVEQPAHRLAALRAQLARLRGRAGHDVAACASGGRDRRRGDCVRFAHDVLRAARHVAEAARRFGDRTAYVTEAGWPLTLRRHRPHLRRSRGRARTARASATATSSRSCCRPAPSTCSRTARAAKLGAITAGVNDRLSARERAAVLDARRARSSSIDDVRRPPIARRRARRRSRDPADAARRSPTIPTGPVAIIFTSGTTGLPEGRAVLQPAARVHHRRPTSATRGTAAAARSRGTSFAHLGFMTKLPGNLRRGGTNFIMTRWRAGRRARAARTRTDDDGRRRADPARADAAPTRLRRLRPVVACSSSSSGGGPVTPGLAEEARRRFGARLATRYSCTEAGIGLGTAFDDPDEDAIVSVGRPHPSVELAVLDDDDRPVAAGRGRRRCACAPPRHVGLLARPGADRGRVHRRRLRAHRRPRLDRRPRPPAPRRAQQGDVRPRRLQRVPGRGRGACCRRIPTSPRSRSCPAPTS